MKFFLWAIKKTFMFFAELCALPFMLAAIIILWPIIEIMEAYDNDCQKGNM